MKVSQDNVGRGAMDAYADLPIGHGDMDGVFGPCEAPGRCFDYPCIQPLLPLVVQLLMLERCMVACPRRVVPPFPHFGRCTLRLLAELKGPDGKQVTSPRNAVVSERGVISGKGHWPDSVT